MAEKEVERDQERVNDKLSAITITWHKANLNLQEQQRFFNPQLNFTGILQEYINL